jgi:hypothetical protein
MAAAVSPPGSAYHRPVPERVLSRRELNRALLARQLLLERSRLPLVRALERVGGIQAQYAPSAYVGLWSRLEGFRLEDLTRALEQRRAIQATLLRATIHVVSRGDYWPWHAAIAEPQRKWWLRVNKILDPATIDRADERFRELLAGGPLRRGEVVARLGKETFAASLLPLVRVPPSGTWEQRRADLYATAESWVGPPAATPADGRELLVRRYLGGFGPAARADLASWAGVNVGDLAPAFERLALRRFRDEAGRELLDLPRAPLPPAEAPAPVRFLPTWDATLLVHARRTQILPEEYRPAIFATKTPHSFPTFLVDGSVAGKWRVERTKRVAELRLEPFARLPAATRDEAVAEGERLLRFVEADADRYRVTVTSA